MSKLLLSSLRGLSRIGILLLFSSHTVQGGSGLEDELHLAAASMESGDYETSVEQLRSAQSLVQSDHDQLIFMQQAFKLPSPAVYPGVSVMQTLHHHLDETIGQSLRFFDERHRRNGGAKPLIRLSDLHTDPKRMPNIGTQAVANMLPYQGKNLVNISRSISALNEHICPSLVYVAPHTTKPVSLSPHKPLRVGFLSNYVNR
jgi:hypothetical protein